MGIEVNREMIEKLTQLDDATLQQAIRSLAVAAGVDAKQADKAVGNVKKLKKKIGAMTDKDIRETIDRVGEEKAAEILNQLKL